MKKTVQMIIAFILIVAMISSAMVMTALAEDDDQDIQYEKEEKMFDLEITIPESVKAGDIFDVIISVKNIKSPNGLIAVSFQLDFNLTKVTPEIISPDPKDCTPYDAFIIKSPQYIMDTGEQEVYTSCYENISRCYYEGCIQTYYDFKFLDKIFYPMKKEGTEPDSVIRNDDDFVLSIPFRINDDVVVGEEVYFYASMTVGTDAGNENEDPATVLGGDCLVRSPIISGETSVTETNDSETLAENTETSPVDSETEPSFAETESSVNGSDASDTETHNSDSTTAPDNTPDTSDTGLTAVALLISVFALSVIVKKRSIF